MTIISGTDPKEYERRDKIIHDTAEEILKLLLTKKMSYADTSEALDTAQFRLEEFTYPVHQDS